MPPPFHTAIEIRDPEKIAIAATFAAAHPPHRLALSDNSFAGRFFAMLELCSRYIATTPVDRIGCAEIFADPHADHDFYFVIWDCDPDDRDERRRVLAGCLHYQRQDQTWGIHT